MKDILDKLRNIEAECCVTIVLSTHRNKPDIQKDVIVLKNLIAEAEQKLLNTQNKRLALSLADKIKKIAASIDHGHNLESLVIFVNEDIAEYVKLPVEVEDRVVIERTFSVRDLIRAQQLQQSYYILVLSRDKARLIEAFNDQEVKEFDVPFPIENTDLYLTTERELSKARQKDFMIEEFFNRVDKTLWDTIGANQQPVIICTEERNFYYYLKITDYKERILGHLNQNRLDEKAAKIVLEAWPMVLDKLKEKNNQRIQELQQAVNKGNFISDTGEIWRALNEGRGQTLFIRQGYFQPARVSNNLVEVLDTQNAYEQDVVEDIIEKMIDVTGKFGGEIVFLPEQELAQFQGIALVTRF